MGQKLHPGRLIGKTALITGGAGGLGAAMARLFVEHGARVCVADLEPDRIDHLVNALNAQQPDSAFGLVLDVTNPDDWASGAVRLEDRFGGLNILVHNAGIATFGHIERESFENFRRVMDVDCGSIFLGTKSLLPLMKRSVPGSIVVVASIAGTVADGNLPAYNAAKAGAWLLSKSIALYCAKNGLNIRCNSIHPAFIKTPIISPFTDMAGGDEAKAHARLIRSIPLGRLGEPEDVAYLALYLASDEARFVTGAEFKIDGGLSA